MKLSKLLNKTVRIECEYTVSHGNQAVFIPTAEWESIPANNPPVS
jgi:hypothetical protein